MWWPLVWAVLMIGLPTVDGRKQATDIQQQCFAHDYKASFSQCEDGRRQVQYIKNATCTGPQLLDGDSVGCSCTPEEYIPQYGPCRNGYRKFLTYTHPSHCTPSRVQVPHPLNVRCACTEADIGSEYTKCDPDTGYQRLVHYFVNSCDPSNMPLPPPKEMLCNISCPSGEFLAPPHADCTPCPAGTYSVKGTWKDTWDEHLSHPWTTSCIGTFCQSWKGYGNYIDSGTQDHPAILSILSLTVPLMSDEANVTLVFRVESQWGWDFFSVYINGIRQDMSVEDTTGINKEWSEYTFDLHQQECEAEMEFNHQSHCLTRHYFDPPCPQYMGNAMQAEAVLPKNDARIGCEEDDWNGVHLMGKIAVTKRGNCSFVQKAESAQARGAVGLIIINTSDDPIRMVGDASTVTIPVAITAQQAGVPLLEDLTAGEKTVLDITTKYVKEANIEFYYSKWANPAIREKPGADRVYIKSVRTEGTLKAAKQCYHCKPGQYSKAGAAKCETCPANTFSKKGDADNCKSCPYHQMSLPGATKCTKSTNCTLEDYIVKRGKCHQVGSEFKSHVTYQNAFDPPLCSGGLEKPKAHQGTCPACPPGTRRSKKDGHCEICDGAGEFMRGDVCKTCPLGSAAVRELVYENFDGEIPENFKISCNGQCLDPWHFMTTHGEAEQGEGQFVNVLASGRGLATDSEAVLTVKVKLYTTGMVGFRYFNLFSPEVHLGKLPQTAVFEVKRQDTDKHPFHLEVPLHVSEYSRHILQYRTPPLDAGEYHLVFTYTKQPGVEFALRSLTVVGEESGGARRCTPCPKGTYCPPHTNLPYPCPVGEYNPETNKDKCLQCPPGLLSDPTRTQCMLCPMMMVPHEVGGYCVLKDCKYTMPVNNSMMTWDLSKLGLIHVQSRGETKEMNSIYHISFCSAIRDAPKAAQEEDPATLCGNRDHPSFACASVEGAPPVGLGSIPALEYQFAPKGRGDLTISYTGGDICKGTRSYTTKVSFICQPPKDKKEIVEFDPTRDAKVSVVDECDYHIEIKSALACPLCSNASYTWSLGECKGNKMQTKTWVLKEDAICYGGVMKVDEEVACTMVVNVAIGFNVFTGAVLLILGVFAVLILCVGYLVHTNRAMYQQYSQARTNECMSEELDDVPCAADDVSIPDPDEPAAAITP